MKPAVAQFYWSQLPQSSRVLDLGCANGELGLHKPGEVEMHGLDLSCSGVAQAKKYYCSAQVWDLDQPGQLPFPAAFFDAVVAKDILEHLQKPWSTLAEIKRVLQPNGYVLASVITHRGKQTWNDYTHVRGFTRQSLRQMFSDAGFEVEAVWPMGGVPLTSRLNLIRFVPLLLRFPLFDWIWTSSYEIRARLPQ